MSVTERKRKLHNKVRTGCQTCKIRRKKCDETKPQCLRCTTTGRQCDGYREAFVTGTTGIVSHDGKSSAVVPTTTNALCDSSSSTPSTPMTTSSTSTESNNSFSERFLPYNGTFHDPEDWRCVAELAKSNHTLYQDHSRDFTNHVLLRPPKAIPDIAMVLDVERHCISYFRCRTIPRLKSYFESSIIRSDLLPCALTVAHPAIFYATAALGAVHRRYSLGISREAFEYCAHAADLYRKAKQSLAYLKKSMSDRPFCLTDSSTIIAATENLLGIFQGFQTEYSASSDHFSAALRYILNSPLQMLWSDSSYCPTQIRRRRFSTMFYMIRCQLTQLFGELMHFTGEDYVFKNLSLASVPAHPEAFENLKTMRDNLFAVVEDVWSTRPLDGLQTKYECIEAYEMRLQAWTHASSRLASSHVLRESWERRAFNLMHIMRSLAYLVLLSGLKISERHRISSMPTLPAIDCTEDPDDDSAEAASILAEAVHPCRMQNPDKALSEAVSMVQDILDKYKIFRCEEGSPFDSVGLSTDADKDEDGDNTCTTSISEDAVEMLGIWSIADKISNVEEDVTLEILKHIIPSNADIRYADIACILLDSRQIGVRYYTINPGGEGYAWVREWWSF